MHVTAVVVAHDGVGYLPDTLAAIAAQTRPADVLIGADAASRDGSGDVLRRSLGAGSVVDAPAAFGAAAAAALAAAPRPTGGAGPVEEWIWLLRDDAAPEPRALAELLLAVERAPAVTVAGCKQLDWDEPRRLVDVGLFASRWAERLPLIDDDEQDQGQYDDRSDMFAVNSAGMLVRRDVWDALGGFDPALPWTGDDVDFCWRARLAGHRVVVVPAARMRHVADRPENAPTPFAEHRAEVYTRLKHAAFWSLPLHFLGAFFAGFWALVAALVNKEPSVGLARCAAALAALGGVAPLARGRRAASRTRAVARRTVRGVRASREEIRSHRRAFLEYSDPDSVIGDGSGSDDAHAEPTGDSDHDFASLAVAARGWAGTGAVVVAVLALVSSIIALIPLLSAQAVTGGGLLPISTDLSAIWQHATSWWTQLGAGQPGHGDPFDLILWALGVLGIGDPNRAVAWTLVLAPAISGLGGWAFASALTSHRWPRVAAGLVWAAAPALQEAVAQGRLGAVVSFVFLPWAALGVIRSVGAARVRGTIGVARTPRPGSGGVPSWTAAAAGGLALAVVTAGSPSLLALAIVVVVLATVALRSRARSLWFILAPSVVLFLPVWASAPDDPRAWLADPGVPAAYGAAAPWQLVLGQPVAFDASAGLGGAGWLPAGVPWALLDALLVGVPVLAAAVAAIVALPGRRGALARSAGAVAVAALALAWAISRLPVAVSGDSLVPAFAGPAVAAALLALLAAAVVGVDRVLDGREAATQSRGPRSAAANRLLIAGTVGLVAALIISVAGPALGLARWAAAGIAPVAAPQGSLGSPLQIAPSQTRTLPATASDLGLGAEQTKTLVLRSTPQGGFTAALMRGAGTTLDALTAVASSSRVTGNLASPSIAADDAADSAIRRAVAVVSSSSGVDPRPDLDALGVGFVVLQQRDAADSVTASQMDAVPGLVAVGQTDVGWLWRVTPSGQQGAKDTAIAHRASIVDVKGNLLATVDAGPEEVHASVPAGPEGRLFVLAERSDSHWSAWMNGHRLTSTTQGWAQAFTLPAAGGQVEVRYDQPAALPLGLLAAVVLILAGLTAIPTRPAPRRRTHGSQASGRARGSAGSRGAITGAPASEPVGAPADEPVGDPARQPATEAARHRNAPRGESGQADSSRDETARDTNDARV
ncbi:glycosyltransferase family 2 protein [Sinomonas terrae]|uniref:Glycosyltransferase family 2 protein n=1 Tax=Sinomonas terrae TaxID=2908838 RepID=A0ABS9U3F1_9MICC|nr:glycosyltransferase family 2 protein [Sinomonas terrae]MCH6471120.1 glycosyltransferase family 2 protein [Sinomonas terrae]